MNKHRETGFVEERAGEIIFEFSKCEREHPMVEVTLDDESPAIRLPSACLEGLAIAVKGLRDEKSRKRFYADLDRVLKFIAGNPFFTDGLIFAVRDRVKSKQDLRELLYDLRDFSEAFAGKNPDDQSRILNAIEKGEEKCMEESRQHNKT
jgi:hypothetical protein